MRRNVVLGKYNRATYLDQTQQLCRKNVKPKVSFAHAIYHTSKHFWGCVGACTCDCISLWKAVV